MDINNDNENNMDNWNWSSKDNNNVSNDENATDIDKNVDNLIIKIQIIYLYIPEIIMIIMRKWFNLWILWK